MQGEWEVRLEAWVHASAQRQWQESPAPRRAGVGMSGTSSVGGAGRGQTREGKGVPGRGRSNVLAVREVGKEGVWGTVSSS